MAALFDALAPTYDMTGVPFFTPIAAGLVAALDPRPGETLLDIGCGRGAVMLQAAPLAAPGAVTGIDISPLMIEQARSAALAAGLGNVTARVGSAVAPDVAPSSQNVVASSLVLFFLPDPVAALRAWLEVLTPGGRMGATTFAAQDHRWAEIDAVLLPYAPANDARTSGAEGPFSSDAGVETMLRAAGYTDVHTVPGSIDVDFDSPEQWLAFSMSTGQRAAWARVPEGERPTVRERALSRFRGFARPDGGATFTQAVRHSLGSRPAA